MEKAAKGDTTEVIAEEIVADAKEAVIEAPSRMRQKLRRLAAAVWGRASVRSNASGSDVVYYGYYGLAGMYCAEFQALAKEHERVRSDKG
jgi:hypothetical protein